MYNWTFVGRYIEADALVVKQHLNSYQIKTKFREIQPGVLEVYVPFSRASEASDLVADITDYDGDGVPDSTDCDPNDPTKQDFGGPAKPRPQLLGGYPIDDYYYTGDKYELQPGAQQDKSWLKRERR